MSGVFQGHGYRSTCSSPWGGLSDVYLPPNPRLWILDHYPDSTCNFNQPIHTFIALYLCWNFKKVNHKTGFLVCIPCIVQFSILENGLSF